MDELEKRRDDLLKKIYSLKDKQRYIIWLILAGIAYFGYFIRTQNLGLLKDVTTGKFIPLALDPYAFLRYARYLLEHGQLMATDIMRYYPLGFSSLSEFRVLTYFIVYLHKFLDFFSSSFTLEKVHVLYPAIAFVIGLVFFFLFVRKIFNWKVGLIASAFLTVLPTYLYRTMAGFSDKESLAMVFLFAALFFYFKATKDKQLWQNVVFGLLAGICTGFLGLVWGGVQFMFLGMGIYAFLAIFFNKFRKVDFFIYAFWMIPMMIITIVGYSSKFSLLSFIFSTTSSIMILAFFAGLINLLFFQYDIIKVKNKVKNKLPLGFASILIAMGLGLLGILLVKEGSFIYNLFSDIFVTIAKPVSESRWILTVAESRQPYFTDWAGQFGWEYLWLVLGASILLFYEMVKPIGKKVLHLTCVYGVFILLFVLSRYSSTSVFDGNSTISILAFVGSWVGFFGIMGWSYIKSYYKDKEIFQKIRRIDQGYFFIFIWFIIMVLAARTAIRLLFVFSPITSIMIAFLILKLFEKSFNLKQNIYKIGAIVLIILLFGNLFLGFSNTVLNQGKYTGPSYNQQWQQGMKWVRDNTPKDAVFAHWWDYGYWVQTGGERATLSDGGNARGAINHFIGRHVLTTPNETDALELLKANNATHLLMIVDEVGKYPAYSSIGADADYDRYSWNPTYKLDT